eukprot:256381_1
MADKGDATRLNVQQIEFNIQFPPTCPKSDIVFDEDTDWKQKVQLLYNKYVANDAVFMINIPHQVKKHIDKIICNQQPTTIKPLLHIFVDAQFEVWMMMKGSFQRFQKTTVYQAFIENYRKTSFRMNPLNLISVHNKKADDNKEDNNNTKAFDTVVTKS